MTRIEALNEVAAMLASIGVASNSARMILEATPKGPDHDTLKREHTKPITESCDALIVFLLKHFDGDEAKIAGDYHTRDNLAQEIGKVWQGAPNFDVGAMVEASDSVVVTMAMATLISKERALFDTAASKHFATFASAYRSTIIQSETYRMQAHG